MASNGVEERSIGRSRVVIGLAVAVALVPAAVYAQAAGSGSRLAGPDRFTTAVEISRAAWAPGEATTAFLASGDAFPDALALGASTKGRGPILLVQRDDLPDVVANEITRLLVCEVVTVGGEQAVEEAVSAAAEGLVSRSCDDEPPVDEAASPTPSPSPVPGPQAGDLGTRENPFPVGTVVPLVDDWEMAVLDGGVQQIGEGPSPGQLQYVARVTATYRGSGSAQFGGTFRLRAVGDAAVSYSTFENSCGTSPSDALPDSEVFTGGTIEGEVCWQIAESDVESLVIFDTGGFEEYEDGTQPFFATP